MKTFPEEIDRLARSAAAAARAGNAQETARLWTEIMGRAPDHPGSLFFFARRAMDERNLPRAMDLLRRAAASDPGQPAIHLNIAYVAQSLGDVAGEGQALDAAIKIDPYFFPALLNKGYLLERIGRRRQAAQIYRNALKIAPSDAELPESLRAHAVRARNVVEAEAASKKAFLEQRLADARAAAGGDPGQFDEALAIMAGAAKAYVHEPTDFHYPGLPATCFFARERFPWLAKLEAATDTIAAELELVLERLAPQFQAYVQKPEGSPVNQWAELNHSKRWSALFLWRDGARVDEVCSLAPKTAALLATLPMIDIPGLAPSAFFSALDPKTRIPPHTGVTNVRSIVHLPLIVPGNTGFRVGNDKRPFEKGKAWVFDDSIEHEAWNDSPDRRVILIFDVWNPNLSETGRTLVRDLWTADRDYEAG